MNNLRPVLTFAEVINEYLTFNHALQCKTPDGIGELVMVDNKGNVVVTFDFDKNNDFAPLYPVSKITPIFKPFESLDDNIIATGLITTLCHTYDGHEINPIYSICRKTAIPLGSRM